MNESDILLRILEMHVGEDKAITRDRLLQSLELDHGVHISDREMRSMIQELRMTGHLIISSSNSKGYWLAACMAEFEMFEHEELSRIERLRTTITRMRKSAIDTFGDSYQPGLI